MKKLLLILLLLPFIGSAQTTNPYPFFQLKDMRLTFEKVYDVPNTNANDLCNKLKQLLPTLPGVNIFNAEAQNQFSGRFVKSNIPYQKYGGKWINTPLYLQYPYYANFTVMVKDNKYKVIISSIYFDLSQGDNKMMDKVAEKMDLEDFLTKRKKTEFKTTENITKGGAMLEHYFSDLFTLNKPSDNW